MLITQAEFYWHETMHLWNTHWRAHHKSHTQTSQTEPSKESGKNYKHKWKERDIFPQIFRDGTGLNMNEVEWDDPKLATFTAAILNTVM